MFEISLIWERKNFLSCSISSKNFILILLRTLLFWPPAFFGAESGAKVNQISQTSKYFGIFFWKIFPRTFSLFSEDCFLIKAGAKVSGIFQTSKYFWKNLKNFFRTLFWVRFYPHQSGCKVTAKNRIVQIFQQLFNKIF